jgi:hypothetical protein
MNSSLNTARIALVSLAVVAAVVATLLGQYVATAVLLAGVAIHGFGWVYLARQKRRDLG